MKTYGPIILAIILFAGLVSFVRYKSDSRKKEQVEKIENERVRAQEKIDAENRSAFSRLKTKADSALAYCKAKGLNTQYCCLIDFSIHSGKKRFFVWDFKKDTIKYSSLCCHGYGQKSTQSKPIFSNVEGSYCSSLGKYKTGAHSYSNWGINVHYKLHGLDKTNSNAFKRWVVLHSHTPISESEIYPNHLPLGWSQGCPVINDNIMRKIDVMLRETKKPVLLWIYN
ncbi:murein L,D-transpeptidase catalytic domain family protein [Dysgonomonas sp. Marseille-P4677]|uniref:murein L,D-transpeptidase catalytic domain-containing protein n=1 Tax=Dysgonomonas sp. Marseille-P4677 TaxID=2364790 RepID=UPI001913F075|nr:murein L,D-transpeptidase catalytic domain family protein [Dysgonomonas sp. Marseille-P4677]MBK5720324.1 murein L,D-transpeptidase catalytic domain family protein [Dysgonomonas sp. Marseille-P4677]